MSILRDSGSFHLMTLPFPRPQHVLNPLHVDSWWMNRENGKISWKVLKTRPGNGMLNLLLHLSPRELLWNLRIYTCTEEDERLVPLLDPGQERPLFWGWPLSLLNRYYRDFLLLHHSLQELRPWGQGPRLPGMLGFSGKSPCNYPQGQLLALPRFIFPKIDGISYVHILRSQGSQGLALCEESGLHLHRQSGYSWCPSQCRMESEVGRNWRWALSRGWGHVFQYYQVQAWTLWVWEF